MRVLQITKRAKRAGTGHWDSSWYIYVDSFSHVSLKLQLKCAMLPPFFYFLSSSSSQRGRRERRRRPIVIIVNSQRVANRRLSRLSFCLPFLDWCLCSQTVSQSVQQSVSPLVHRFSPSPQHQRSRIIREEIGGGVGRSQKLGTVCALWHFIFPWNCGYFIFFFWEGVCLYSQEQ